MSKPTIKAPNGTTSFIKPDFDVMLYEELYPIGILGRVDLKQMSWSHEGVCYCEGVTLPMFNLTPVPQPWYENLGDGILCWVYNIPHEQTAEVISSYEENNAYPYLTSENSGWAKATPLTPEEAMKYVAKQ